MVVHKVLVVGDNIHGNVVPCCFALWKTIGGGYDSGKSRLACAIAAKEEVYLGEVVQDGMRRVCRFIVDFDRPYHFFRLRSKLSD